MKDELGEKIMLESEALTPEIYGYLTQYIDEDEKSKRNKNFVIKRKFLNIINIVQKELNLKIK